ncbi:PREDICTED: general mRNAion factor 3C polypeptide 6 [Prunus dulcis]|uniref:PREDICTED: general mRNAion factor 3C polypeptide 6 n=2 Tax=Prunus dulcis TaxID=3755 RepID=A0A5E4GMS6_PRUDU|nr:PREDICTED: general mRNAion factor 3C polypeptide 6 [Prunus dulcis]
MLGGAYTIPLDFFQNGPFCFGLASNTTIIRHPILRKLRGSQSAELETVRFISSSSTLPTLIQAMEANTVRNEDEVEEEYVLLDLDSAYSQFDIPPNAPYVLSGLNTEHPVLTIGDKLNLIGEYHETVGTCLIFKEEVASPVVHEETGPSEANLFAGKCIVDPNQPQSKQVKPVTSLHRIIKFRLAPNVDSDDASKQTPDQVQHTVHSMGNDQHENP